MVRRCSGQATADFVNYRITNYELNTLPEIEADHFVNEVIYQARHMANPAGRRRRNALPSKSMRVVLILQCAKKNISILTSLVSRDLGCYFHRNF